MTQDSEFCLFESNSDDGEVRLLYLRDRLVAKGFYKISFVGTLTFLLFPPKYVVFEFERAMPSAPSAPVGATVIVSFFQKRSDAQQIASGIPYLHRATAISIPLMDGLLGWSWLGHEGTQLRGNT